VTKIRFIQQDQREFVVDARDGESVMRAALDNGVPGIAADCGGCLSCATCHVYIAEDWLDRLEPASEDEVAALEIAVDPQPNSRLSCQVIVSPTIDGLTVNVPERQF
jgi:2Fe-2S ferredoxin